jgi:hypothetical protein
LAHIYAHSNPELVTLDNQLVELPYAEPSSDGGGAALKVILANHDMPIHNFGGKSRCFMDLIQWLYLSVMALMEKNSHLETPKKPLLQDQPLLLGWELMSVVTSPHSPQPKEHRLLRTSGGWSNFASDVLVLFGDGFGDLILPCAGQNHLCNKWVATPTSKDYLTANISMLQVLSGRWGYSDTCHKVSEFVQWIQSEDLFPDCRHSSHKKCHGPLQKLKKLKKRGRKKPFENHLANKPPGGAVIFGKPTSKMRLSVSICRGSDDEKTVSKSPLANNHLLRPGMKRQRHDLGYSTGDPDSEDPDSADEEAQSTTEPTPPIDPVVITITEAIPEPQRPPPTVLDPIVARDDLPRGHDHISARKSLSFGGLLRIGVANVLPSLLICSFAVMFTQWRLLKWPSYESSPNTS